VNPLGKDARGRLFGKDKGCCLGCAKRSGRNPVFSLGTGTSNAWEHLKKCNPQLYEELKAEVNNKKRKGADEEAASVEQTATPALSHVEPLLAGQKVLDGVGAGSFSGLKVEKRVKVLYTQEQLLNQFAAGHLKRPYHYTDEDDMRTFYQMLGFRVPAPRTIQTRQEMFEEQCTGNVISLLQTEGITNPDGTSHVLPLASIAYDTSPTGVDGVHAITLNLHFLDKNFQAYCILLACEAFIVKDSVALEGITRGTADNLATWVVDVLKRFRIVPAAQATRKVDKYIYATTVDNATAEVKASADIMGTYVQRCGSHSFDLPLKHIFKTPANCDGTDSGEEQDALDDDMPDDVPLPDSQPVLHAALIVLRFVRAAAKLSRATKEEQYFRRDQEVEGIVEPLNLIMRSATRWANTAKIVDRVLLLRQFMHALLSRLNLQPLSDEEWRTLMQVGAILHETEVLTTQLQSRGYLIGDHLGRLYNYMHMLSHPETLRVHHPSFEPSVAQINAATRSGRPCNDEPAYARFDMWDNEWRKQRAVPGVLTPDADAVRRRLLEEYTARCRAKKAQFCSLPLRAGAALHPSFKPLIFGQETTMWLPVEKAEGQAELRRLLLKVTAATFSTAPPAGQSASVAPRNPMLCALAGVDVLPAAPPVDDEFEAWKREPPQQLLQAEFWAQQLNGISTRFKNLARVARTVLSAPNTNAQGERDFSLAKQLLAPHRKSMSAETFARKMFLIQNRRLWNPNPGLILTGQV
jgi:hAT family C-terminal dimerisation region